MCCLSLYTAYVYLLAGSDFLKSPSDTLKAGLCFLAATVGLAAAFSVLGTLIIRWKGFAPRPLEKHRLLWYAIFLALSLAIFGIALAAEWPGGVSYDASNQWRQALSGEYNNWHPVFHTLMIRLVTRFTKNYTLLIILQIIAAAAAQARLSLTLCESGVPVPVVLVIHWITCSTLGARNPLLTLSKDSAMTFGMLILADFCVRILFSGGEWLLKKRRWIWVGLAAGWVCLVRHNGLFIIAPLLCCLFCLFKAARKKALCAAALCAAVVLLVRGPVYGALDIVYPDNFTEESVGVPMTVLGDIRSQCPEALTDEARAFMDTLTTQEAWEKGYILHNYNSIKFTYDHEWIKEKSFPDICRMALESGRNAPRVAFEAVNGVTDLVWDVLGKNEGYMPVSNSGDLPDVAESSGRVKELGQKLLPWADAPMFEDPLKYLTRNIGAEMLLLLCVTMLLMKRNGLGGLLLTLPLLCYNLGTMLLLCGNDARFFQCSLFLCLPWALALIWAPRRRRLSCPNE